MQEVKRERVVEEEEDESDSRKQAKTSSRIVVENIGSAGDPGVRSCVETYGNVLDLIVCDSFAFVEFSSKEEADNAVSSLHGKHVFVGSRVAALAKSLSSGDQGTLLLYFDLLGAALKKAQTRSEDLQTLLDTKRSLCESLELKVEQLGDKERTLKLELAMEKEKSKKELEEEQMNVERLEQTVAFFELQMKQGGTGQVEADRTQALEDAKEQVAELKKRITELDSQVLMKTNDNILISKSLQNERDNVNRLNSTVQKLRLELDDTNKALETKGVYSKERKQAVIADLQREVGKWKYDAEMLHKENENLAYKLEAQRTEVQRLKRLKEDVERRVSDDHRHRKSVHSLEQELEKQRMSLQRERTLNDELKEDLRSLKKELEQEKIKSSYMLEKERARTERAKQEAEHKLLKRERNVKEIKSYFNDVIQIKKEIIENKEKEEERQAEAKKQKTSSAAKKKSTTTTKAKTKRKTRKR